MSPLRVVGGDGKDPIPEEVCAPPIPPTAAAATPIMETDRNVRLFIIATSFDMI